MADYHSDRPATRPGRDTWRHDNERGLALAADGDWVEASEAFAAAADCLARAVPSETRDVHEPLALVLSNLAQAYFRLGRTDDAMQQAQRACALRVAIAGEDGMPVARARMDLAVMLATAGRLDEATALVQRAIAGIEHRVGEEDARLAVVLENAARIALAAGAPANAEPLLLRLHALLGAHELSTSRAEQLLARVAAWRAPQAAAETVEAQMVATVASATAAATDPDDLLASFDDDALARVYAHASVTEQAEWDDQPLRDAVAVTDVLLRTTPSGVPIIPAPALVEPPSLDANAAAVEEVDAMLDVMDFTDVLPSPTLREPDAASMLSIEPTGESSMLDALDLELADVPRAEEPVADAPPAMALESVERAADDVGGEAPTGFVLDFAVEHGLIEDDQPLLEGPPVSSPVPDVLEPVGREEAPATTAPMTAAPVESASTAVVRMADTPAAVQPAAAAPPRPVPEPQPPVTSPPRPMRRTPEELVVLPPPAPPSGNGGRIALIVTAVAVIGGAAAFFLLR